MEAPSSGVFSPADVSGVSSGGAIDATTMATTSENACDDAKRTFPTDGFYVHKPSLLSRSDLQRCINALEEVLMTGSETPARSQNRGVTAELGDGAYTGNSDGSVSTSVGRAATTVEEEKRNGEASTSPSLGNAATKLPGQHHRLLSVTDKRRRQTMHAINVHRASPTLRQIATSRSIGVLVAACMGWEKCGVRLAQDQVWYKPQGAKPLSFHRDTTYFDITPKEVCTVWIPFDDLSTETAAATLGALEYCPGSHRWSEARTGSANQFFDQDYTALLRDAARRESEQYLTNSISRSSDSRSLNVENTGGSDVTSLPLCRAACEPNAAASAVTPVVASAAPDSAVPAPFMRSGETAPSARHENDDPEGSNGGSPWSSSPRVTAEQARRLCTLAATPDAMLGKTVADRTQKVGEVLGIVRVCVEAGGCSIHDGRTWHGSGANKATPLAQMKRPTALSKKQKKQQQQKLQEPQTSLDVNGAVAVDSDAADAALGSSSSKRPRENACGEALSSLAPEEGNQCSDAGSETMGTTATGSGEFEGDAEKLGFTWAQQQQGLRRGIGIHYVRGDTRFQAGELGPLWSPYRTEKTVLAADGTSALPDNLFPFVVLPTC